jgi:ketosteroid isomerase-like protein
MSADRVEIVRALFERWNAGDRGVEIILEYFARAIELESPFSSVVGEPYRGYAGMERWVSDLDEQFTLWSISPHQVREIGNRVIALTTIQARGRASDIPLQFPSAGVLDFAGDDRITRIRIYLDVDEALKAVGQEE